MKATINSTVPTPPKPFPKLMHCKSSGMLILATAYSGTSLVGTCITPGTTGNRVGDCTNRWASEFFGDFVGSVTLEND